MKASTSLLMALPVAAAVGIALLKLAPKPATMFDAAPSSSPKAGAAAEAGEPSAIRTTAEKPASSPAVDFPAAAGAPRVAKLPAAPVVTEAAEVPQVTAQAARLPPAPLAAHTAHRNVAKPDARFSNHFRASTVPIAPAPVQAPELAGIRDFEVEPGVPIPAALGPVPLEVGLSEEQAELKDQIVETFVEEVSRSSDVSESWQAGQERADARFRLLFGADLYRAQSLTTEREALGLSMP